MAHPTNPGKQGLYDPQYEHDACGVGFIVDLKNRRSHDLVRKAIQILLNLEHRGACGCEQNTGDGAGILLQSPHQFLANKCREIGLNLPPDGSYAVGMMFLPTDQGDRALCEQLIESVIRDEGLELIGWRTVPTNNSLLGLTARASQPFIRQVFISRSEDLVDDLAFERKLYVIRRRVTKAVRSATL